MDILKTLANAVETCARVIVWGVGLQEGTRKALVADLQEICIKCEAAYDAVLARLVPVKSAFGDPVNLARELRDFAADGATRDQFKPEHLCSQIDHLLVRLSSHLDPLKYAVDFRRITDLQRSFSQLGHFDGAIFRAYDELVVQLDRIATDIQGSGGDGMERSRYAQHVVQDFEDDLRVALNAVRDTKSRLVGLI
ncbi:MAG: hypothetical protein ACKO0M_10340 [Cyanobium sp.]